MKEPPTNICPLLAIAAIGTNAPADCLEERCAWWDGSLCAIMSLSFSLEELAEKTQTFGDLEKETAPSAANTESGGVEME